MDEDGTGLAIGDLQRGRPTVLDLNTMRCGIQQVAGRSLQFRHGVPAAFSFGEIDDAVAVRCVGADDLTIHLADLELDIPNSLTSVFVGLDDLQSTGRGIVEGQGLEVVGVDDNSLTASVLIDDVAGERLGFCNNKSSDQPGDQYLSILIGSVDAVGADLTVLVRNKAAVSIGYFEFDTL